MKRSLLLALLTAAPAVAAAQDPDPVYQQGKQYSLELKVDGLLRQEFTASPITFLETDRALARVRPRVEIGVDRFLLGVGGDFVFSSERNTKFLPTLPLLRDNYDSRDARLDLAFVRAEPAAALRLHAGRFAMPVRFTEMIWDRDLRPQGAEVTLQAVDRGPFKRLALSALGARGSHVFPAGGAFDFSDRESMWLAAASALAGAGERATVELLASYVTFADLDHLDPRLRRQNTRASAGGPLAHDYDVVDLVGRFNREGRVEVQLVADYCWNTAVDTRNKGLWLAAVLGSARTAPLGFEYTFARIDTDATLAAFAADDFLWETGWEGHRGDLGIRLREPYALHLVAQRQRFKDAPRVEERDLWLERYRIELRVRY
jgi:hypothetical protein